MSDPARTELAEETTRPERGPESGEASVALLLAAIGRVARYGGELVALEALAVRQGARRVAKFHTATWMCALTAWFALNAALASLAYTRLALDPGLALLLLAALNLALAGLMHRLRTRHLREMTRLPLLGFLARRY
jgi:hypothetical protein